MDGMERFLKKFSSEIVDRVSENKILDKLWGEGVITAREKQYIGNFDSCENRSKLIQVLITKDTYVARIFVDIVEDCCRGQNELIEEFREEVSASVYNQARPQISDHIWFGITDVTPEFTGRKQELERLHKMLTEGRDEDAPCHALLTSIGGMGGVGKTSLAKEYVRRYREVYDNNLIWINAEDTETMKLEFSQLASKIGIRSHDQLVSDDLAQNIYLELGDQKCLVIFDNVVDWEGQNGVQQYLPNGLPPKKKKPYILLTSRTQRLVGNNNRQLLLDVFSVEDAVALVRKTLPDASEDAILKLVKKLGRFPLALSQALPYIDDFKDLQENEDEAIQEYLTEFEDEQAKRKLLHKDKYKITLYTTLSISRSRLSSNRMCELLLQHMAYLNPENIHTTFVYTLWSSSNADAQWNRKIRDALAELRKFSMINSEKGELTIHRLVQEVTRFDVDNKAEIEIVKQILRAMENARSLNNGTGGLQIQSILHGTTLLPFYQKHRSELEQFSEFATNLKFDGENLTVIRKQLPTVSKIDAAKLIWRLNRASAAVNLAVGYIKNALPLSVDNYIIKFDTAMPNQDAVDQFTIILTTWKLTMEEILKESEADLVFLLLKHIPYLDINHLSMNVFSQLLKKDETITNTAIRILQRFSFGSYVEGQFVVEGNLFGFILQFVDDLQTLSTSEVICNIAQLFNHADINSEIMHHGITLFDQYLMCELAIIQCPQFPLKLLEHHKSQNSRSKFELTKSKVLSACGSIWGDLSIHTIEVRKLNLNLEQLEGHDLEYQSGTTDFQVTPRMVHRIMTRIIQNVSALDKWMMITDELVPTAVDRVKIQSLIRDSEFKEGISRTLQIWVSQMGSWATLGSLLQILRSHRLNTLADDLQDLQDYH